MKKHKMPDMKEGGVNVTPLIDIVMCLIIFFMLVAKIGVTRGVDTAIKLPDADGARIADMGQTLTLNMHHIDSGFKGPQVTALLNPGSRDVTDFNFEKNGEKSLPALLRIFKKTHEKGSVILRGDQSLVFGELEKVLMAVAEAGITDTAYEVHDPNAEKH